MMNKKVEFIDWGLTDYQEAWDRQELIFNQTIAVKTDNRNNNTTTETPNHLVFVEHPHVYTLGKSGHPENLLLDEQGLVEKEATYYKINRGGDITYHGPGQIEVTRFLILIISLPTSTFTSGHWKMQLS
jgi:lipoyl(octanoyl) transferase